MAFKEFKETFPHRFKSFEEAKEKINENHKQEQLDAIDYMVNHKEYYFLLKNLIDNYAEGGGNKALFDYIFFQLKDCPKRSEDIELYKKILQCNNKDLRLSFLEYLKMCADELFPILYKYIQDDDIKEMIVCYLLYINKDELVEFLRKHRFDKQTLSKFLKEIYLYGTKEDIKCLNSLKELYPEYKDKINDIINLLES